MPRYNSRALKREYDENGTVIKKECRKCDSFLPINKFYTKGKVSVTAPDGYNNTCIECSKAKWRKQAEDPAARKRWLLMRIRSKCKKEGIAFDLTIDDLDIPDVCPVLGRPLKFGVSRNQSYEKRGMAPPTDDSPSVDRIDSDGGYVKGNIVVVSWRVNRIKGNATSDELRAIADYYSDK